MSASTMSAWLAELGQQTARAARRIWAMVTDGQLSHSYYPEEGTKSKPRIFAELVWWLVRTGEINSYYYVCGLDRKSVYRHRDLLPYRQFRRIRDHRNLRIGDSPYNYVCLLQDKFVFAQFVSSLGLPTPRGIGLLDADRVTWLDTNATVPLENIAERRDITIDGFCKKRCGIRGEGAFRLRIESGALYVSDRMSTVAELRSRLSGRHLLQERILQHETMAALHPASVNTIRLITFVTDSGIELFAAALRVGSRGHSVDNWAAGGLIVRIDPECGELSGEGFFKPGYGGRCARHPDTGICFDTFKLPYFPEAVELASRLHGYLHSIHSIGWDVAVTPRGPTIVEGNDDWEGGIPMVLEQDFRRRFLAMYR